MAYENQTPLQEAVIVIEGCDDKGWGYKVKGSGKTYNLSKTVKSTGQPSSAFVSLGSQPPEFGQTYTVKYAEVPYEHEGKTGMSKYIRMIGKGGNAQAQVQPADTQRLSKIETRLAFIEGKLGINPPEEHKNASQSLAGPPVASPTPMQTASPGDDNYISVDQIPF